MKNITKQTHKDNAQHKRARPNIVLDQMMSELVANLQH